MDTTLQPQINPPALTPLAGERLAEVVHGKRLQRRHDCREVYGTGSCYLLVFVGNLIHPIYCPISESETHDSVRQMNPLSVLP